VAVERLQKLIAAGRVARGATPEADRRRRVTVNGKVARLSEQADGERDAIKIDGKRLRPRQRAATCCSEAGRRGDHDRRPRGRVTVIDLVSGRWDKLYPVGRLTFTRGLMILTNDGTSLRVSHPRYGVCAIPGQGHRHPGRGGVERLRRAS
jgi:23S rRNA pseudouridine2605 synthase